MALIFMVMILILPKIQSRGRSYGKGREGIYLVVRDECYEEKAWVPSSLGEGSLGRKEHVFEGAGELEAFSGSDLSILEARGLWASPLTFPILWCFIYKTRVVVRFTLVI